jgi:hypothetical protein
MKYDIRINYDTGDTFKHESGCETTVELQCDLETATENLNRIKEHYDFVQNLTGWNSRWLDENEKKKYNKEALKSKKWYTNSEYWEFCIRLINKDGEEYEQHIDWTGYFESLNYGEVVPHENELPKFTT